MLVLFLLEPVVILIMVTSNSGMLFPKSLPSLDLVLVLGLSLQTAFCLLACRLMRAGQDLVGEPSYGNRPYV